MHAGIAAATAVAAPRPRPDRDHTDDEPDLDPDLSECNEQRAQNESEDASDVSEDEDLQGYSGAAAAYLRDAQILHAELQQALIDSGLSPEQQLQLQQLVEKGHQQAATVIQALQRQQEEQAEAEAAAAMTDETEEFLRTAEELRQKLHTPLYARSEINTLMALFMLLEWRSRLVASLISVQGSLLVSRLCCSAALQRCTTCKGCMINTTWVLGVITNTYVSCNADTK